MGWRGVRVCHVCVRRYDPDHGPDRDTAIRFADDSAGAGIGPTDDINTRAADDNAAAAA